MLLALKKKKFSRLFWTSKGPCTGAVLVKVWAPGALWTRWSFQERGGRGDRYGGTQDAWGLCPSHPESWGGGTCLGRVGSHRAPGLEALTKNSAPMLVIRGDPGVGSLEWRVQEELGTEAVILAVT